MPACVVTSSSSTSVVVSVPSAFASQRARLGHTSPVKQDAQHPLRVAFVIVSTLDKSQISISTATDSRDTAPPFARHKNLASLVWVPLGITAVRPSISYQRRDRKWRYYKFNKQLAVKWTPSDAPQDDGAGVERSQSSPTTDNDTEGWIEVTRRKRNREDQTGNDLEEAIRRAANIGKDELVTICPNYTQNIVVVSAPEENTATKLAKIRTIKTEQMAKGIIRNIPLDYTQEQLIHALVTARNPSLAFAKRLGSTTTVILLYEGYKCPPTASKWVSAENAADLDIAQMYVRDRRSSYAQYGVQRVQTGDMSALLSKTQYTMMKRWTAALVLTTMLTTAPDQGHFQDQGRGRDPGVDKLDRLPEVGTGAGSKLEADPVRPQDKGTSHPVLDGRCRMRGKHQPPTRDNEQARKAQTVAISKTIEEIEKKVTQMGRYTGPAPTSNVSAVINRADTNNINVARADISIARGPDTSS
ncbi:hypothetical protein HPB50_020196 [Hyalomma asiaticum]|uniref:Uncharacterized protein n=1 Tax=Hyalomma asiaticum TaxID=266040 RepID=A0ACB7TKX1_HYAAI|nr:hypothetical protein HPB50_020196 [Hyalomma asiaticum]